jgi:chemotaxis response regulator CheB
LVWARAGAGACTGTDEDAAEGIEEATMAGGMTVVLEAATAAAAAMTGTPTCPFGCTTAVSPTPDMV